MDLSEKDSKPIIEWAGLMNLISLTNDQQWQIDSLVSQVLMDELN